MRSNLIKTIKKNIKKRKITFLVKKYHIHCKNICLMVTVKKRYKIGKYGLCFCKQDVAG